MPVYILKYITPMRQKKVSIKFGGSLVVRSVGLLTLPISEVIFSMS